MSRSVDVMWKATLDGQDIPLTRLSAHIEVGEVGSMSLTGFVSEGTFEKLLSQSQEALLVVENPDGRRLLFDGTLKRMEGADT